MNAPGKVFGRLKNVIPRGGGEMHAGREIRRELDDRRINGSTNIHEWPIGVGTKFNKGNVRQGWEVDLVE